MTRILVMMVGSVLMLTLFACGGNKVDDSTAEKYITQAEEIIVLLNENNYEKVHSKFDDVMKTGLSVKEMNEQLTPIIKESGSFEEIDKASVEEKDGLFTTILAAKYSDENRIFTISFNDKDEVAGLFIK